MTERLPEPDPSRFPRLLPHHVRTLSEDTTVGRIFSQGGDFPMTWNEFRYWGPTSARFDHQPPPAHTDPVRSVMYVAVTTQPVTAAPVLRTCIAECFSETGTVDLTADDPHYVLFRLARPLRLLDVADSDWVALAGGNAAIQSGPRDVARRWARAIYEHEVDDALDGIWYACSIIPSARSVVLWDRALDAVPSRPAFHRPLADSSLRADVEIFSADLHLDLVATARP